LGNGATIPLFCCKNPIVLNSEHISLEVGWKPALNAAEAAQETSGAAFYRA